MGCGKTTVGRKLSIALRCPFIDMDDEIVKYAGMSINEIFALKGEEYFRNLETEMLKRLEFTERPLVVSAGGGLVLRKENREIMKKIGTVFYLKAGVDELYERLKNDDTRPLLKSKNVRQRIEEMLHAREHIYEEAADITVDASEKPAKVAGAIQSLIKEADKGKPEEDTDSKPAILVIHGPNLNFLGIREPDIYGNEDYDDLKDYIGNEARSLGLKTVFFQSNHEGALIDRVQEAYFDGTAGIIINPGAYTHYSYALHDALASVADIPKIEVHLSDITAREGFRSKSVTKDACISQIYGKGFSGYKEALSLLNDMIRGKHERD